MRHVKEYNSFNKISESLINVNFDEGLFELTRIK